MNLHSLTWLRSMYCLVAVRWLVNWTIHSGAGSLTPRAFAHRLTGTPNPSRQACNSVSGSAIFPWHTGRFRGCEWGHYRMHSVPREQRWKRGKKEVDKTILLLCYSNSFQTISSTCVVRDGEDKDADPSLHSDQLSYLGASWPDRWHPFRSSTNGM